MDGFLPNQTEDDVAASVENAVLDILEREAVAAGKPFDPSDPSFRERIDLAVAEALDDMGFLDPPAPVDVIVEGFEAPPEDPKQLTAYTVSLHGRVSNLPEMMVTWDLSEGKKLPGRQIGATTSQIAMNLQTMVAMIGEFRVDNPGKPVTHDAFDDKFWHMFTLAKLAVDGAKAQATKQRASQN